MTRRLSLVALALASLALGACTNPTAPKSETTVEPTCAVGGVTNGSHTKC